MEPCSKKCIWLYWHFLGENFSSSRFSRSFQDSIQCLLLEINAWLKESKEFAKQMSLHMLNIKNFERCIGSSTNFDSTQPLRIKDNPTNNISFLPIWYRNLAFLISQRLALVISNQTGTKQFRTETWFIGLNNSRSNHDYGSW